ncbi:Serine/threonine protein phosphatase 2A 57 kDa regulatory subunit B' kappa isoform, partial [Mucuna pruriens]
MSHRTCSDELRVALKAMKLSLIIATMLKQILSKFPKKVSKSDTSDSAQSDSGFGNVFQCTSVGVAISNKLNAVKRVSSVVFPASMSAGVEAVDPHISFKDVSNIQKQNLFISKLNLCTSVYDMSCPDKNCTEQGVKHQTLVELVDFVSSGSAKFTEQAIAAMCKMCASNLFRVFPPKFRPSATRGETEDEELMFDPAWSNLQIVYDLLLQVINYNSLDLKVAKMHIDHTFIVRLLDLFDSEDPRERDCLKAVLHRIYGKFMVHRPFIRKSVSNIIYRFVFETEHHNGIAELLEIFGSVICGFALPLKEEHIMFLCRALIPLHKPKSVGIYHQQLTFCVVQFIDKDPTLASTVIMGLLKYWPVTNSQKELMFISELEEVLDVTIMTEFQKIMVPLFRRIACCLNSYHYQVAERAHLLWNNEHILEIVTQNRQVILPLVFSALVHNTQNHWNRTVLNQTENIRKMLSNMDEDLVLACHRKLEEEDSRSGAAAERRRITWERLEAAANVQHVAVGGDVLASPACSVAC